TGYELSTSEEITFTIEESQEEILTLDGPIENEVLTTDIVLTKEDSITGDRLNGATFELTYEDGDYSFDALTKTTSGSGIESGRITCDNLKPGTYHITELSASGGYIKDDEPIVVVVTHNDVDDEDTVFNVTAENDPLAYIILEKEDSETGYKLQ